MKLTYTIAEYIYDYEKRACDKTGLDWIDKTWINKTWRGKTKTLLLERALRRRGCGLSKNAEE